MKRTTIRFNDLEEAELNRIKALFNLEDDSKAIKMCVEWVNSYVGNVTKAFFPPSYDVILRKKTKTYSKGNKVIND